MVALMTVTVMTATSCTIEGGTPYDNTPVSSFEIDRYLGSWFEIARYDHRFERGLTNAMAKYSLAADGTVKVENSGWEDGEKSTAEGVAKLTATPGLLRVSFFGPFFSDYRVLLVDEAYTYALVGSKSRDYLWILCRTPRLTDEARATVLGEMSRRGYEKNDLIWVDHSRNFKLYNF